MKKIIICLLCIACLLSVASCGKKNETVNKDETKKETEVTDITPKVEYVTKDEPAAKVNKVVNADEMEQYNKIFFDKDTSFDNTEMTKTGIFTILYDAFYAMDRYYVWGYSSDSATEGWQWEFTVADPSTLPKVGSEVTVKGMFVEKAASEDGSKTNVPLDGRWIENADVTVVSEYNNSLCKYDLTTMSPILSARVQVPNIVNNLDKFNDKICLYAKVGENNMLTSTYDELSWSVHTLEGTSLPDVGTIVTVVGTFNEHGQFITETLNIEG
ncbi:MAG: hypothetical protein IKU52_02645 [Clostridia bacterium]|nr:hypothetical protein [Clostridia bacterium]